MIYHSPSPFEIGAFDIDATNDVALEIANGDYIIEENDANYVSGRLVVDRDEDTEKLLEKIGFYNSQDQDHSLIRTRLYAQNFAQIHRPSFPGLSWHVDSEIIQNDDMTTRLMFDLNFGSNHHPTEYVVGDIDLTSAHEFGQKFLGTQLDAPSVLYWCVRLAGLAVEEAKEKGTAEVLTMEPGILYRIQKGTVHRMQNFDDDKIYQTRFCIEQYQI